MRGRGDADAEEVAEDGSGQVVGQGEQGGLAAGVGGQVRAAEFGREGGGRAVAVAEAVGGQLGDFGERHAVQEHQGSCCPYVEYVQRQGVVAQAVLQVSGVFGVAEPGVGLAAGPGLT
ncbi:hypothetical protein ADK47_28205 [Streptomyces rimosus subsp. rimosus]|nr:hypothetical protein ADK78_29730 [Kitasatospora aureofaciens]KOT33442.1 hypothetical protein ADK42_24515 [Streptomyces rimosus subsp. rimosus]KOT41542.1 hypothetical protein ADK84_11675 [Streptomyces sp. NRRL WC-3701]QDA08775.1 hypothetical protein CTZ40_38505 [Streptomyces rimosus]KOT54001.1 hypothetical protein ADK44_28185 [Streptomyces rimosus subsp. rimosus]